MYNSCMDILTFFEHDFYKTDEFIKAYDMPNYEILETPEFPISDDNNPEKLPTCAIYFTSAGWYHREDLEDFKKKTFEKNRYEWKKNLIKTAQKHIFVRDLYLTWYVNGINSTLNTKEKLAEFLKEQTKGYRVITLGASAGGYMAAYIGILLDAYKMFSFCGQFAMRYDIVHMGSVGNFEDMAREYKGDGLYFFTARDFVNDVYEYNFSLSCENIKTFLFKTDVHGVPFPLSALTDVLNMPKSKLNKLYDRYKGKEINILDFAYRVAGIKFIFPILKDSLRHFRKFSKNAFK